MISVSIHDIGKNRTAYENKNYFAMAFSIFIIHS